ncbi:glycosyltransferase family 2 protein [Xanthobacter versatilis]|uniref:glycosyltransferase family 2 protein n=1 Tax=Xanthobacter autotrophicus (strain ATCC BAA-1158 / Py2) TaxID=78245 RepID=UPI003728AB04
MNPYVSPPQTGMGVIAVPPAVPELSVIVPTFNERDNVEVLFAQLEAALDAVAWEAIFVDDDSPDGTADTVRAIGARDGRARCIRRVGRRGLAGACIEGMLAAQAPVVAVIDADLQHDPSALRTMLDLIRAGADLVVASRYMEGGSADAFDRQRSWLSRTATTMAKWLPGVSTSDPMSGFFMIRRDVVEARAPHLSRHGFKILLDIMTTTGRPLACVDVPFTFGARQAGESKLDRRTILDFLALLASKAIGATISPRFLWFSAVGGLGLLLHLAVLKGALAAGLAFAGAQAVATLCAMTSNFALNNALTYRDRRVHGWRIVPALAKFYAICGAGAVANVGVASWVFWGGSRWWAAGVAGSLIGAVWNYAMSTALVWGADE